MKQPALKYTMALSGSIMKTTQVYIKQWEVTYKYYALICYNSELSECTLNLISLETNTQKHASTYQIGSYTQPSSLAVPTDCGEYL